MTDLLDLAERLWDGRARYHPFRDVGARCEVADGTLFVHGFATSTVLETDEGLVIVDTGSLGMSGAIHESVRDWSIRPSHTIVFTHGHIDHCFGVERYDADNHGLGVAPPTIVAHHAITDRFDRYRATAGYNGIVNQRQFSLPEFSWPTEYRYPDETYVDRHMLTIGGERFELHHARGETDDGTWVWAPDRRVLCAGDLFTWAAPNCGNPQKAQRYPAEWAAALRTMAALDAEVLLPGHGLPIVGAKRVRQALSESADLLEHLVTGVLDLMNAGATLDDVVHTVRAPVDLLERPYLRPVYDDPEFILHNLWRLYGGWYDGNPARLKPPRDADLAREVADLAGGVTALVDRSRSLADAGELRLAAQVAEWAAQAAPDDLRVHAARAQVYRLRVAEETSIMAKGIFRWAVAESERDRG
ncbi:MAG TPA: alkyl sulfatase dimerization domain-containing protein [Acidimicrobiia bacterium]|nr:alkyl sulfatase dimerization domain-containing protein [Acidimicrobiia bacterium]